MEVEKKLLGKTVKEVEHTDETLMLKFDDGTTLVVNARSGGGADSNWYNWTEVTLDGQKIIDK